MNFRIILSGLLILFLGTILASAEDYMTIHTEEENFVFILSDIDSITFTTEDGPNAGDTAVFNLTDDVTYTMVWIPSGEFQMGAQDGDPDANDNERPQHPVTFNYGFWMGKYEVTQDQWEAVMGDNPAHDYGVGDDYPVYYVSWNDIQSFESELNDEFRLPSESEWEYACRAGTQTRFYWGPDADYEDIDDYAVYDGNDNGRTAEVGTKDPNNWGLYDMSGNVWEWCEDRWHSDYEDAPDDGSPWLDDPVGSSRVDRGGGWGHEARSCRSARRSYNSPSARPNSLGFRLARSND